MYKVDQEAMLQVTQDPKYLPARNLNPTLASLPNSEQQRQGDGEANRKRKNLFGVPQGVCRQWSSRTVGIVAPLPRHGGVCERDDDS